MMGKRYRKAVALLTMSGVLLGSGCLAGAFNLKRLARDAVEFTAFEFLLDNDGVFDLFQDDFGTGTQFDDRETDAPSREEPPAA